MVVRGGLTKSWEKKRSESKREKERYTHLKEELQRIESRDKKIFLTEQCKEIEESNRMGKTRELVEKAGDTHDVIVAKLHLFGAKWELSPGDSTSDNSQRLPQRGSGGGQYIGFWWMGSSVQSSTYFTEGFLLVSRSWCHHEGIHWISRYEEM